MNIKEIHKPFYVLELSAEELLVLQNILSRAKQYDYMREEATPIYNLIKEVERAGGSKNV